MSRQVVVAGHHRDGRRLLHQLVEDGEITPDEERTAIYVTTAGNRPGALLGLDAPNVVIVLAYGAFELPADTFRALLDHGATVLVAER